LKKYDPDRPVDPQGWLELDESERIAFVESHHRRAGVRLPNAHLHAVIHTIVENQLASNEPEVVAALGRLGTEGLSRHDSVHAIGQVLATTMNEGVTGVLGSDLSAPYAARLRSLTAERWLKQELE